VRFCLPVLAALVLAGGASAPGPSADAVVVELLPAGPSPLDVTVSAPQELAFVNRTALTLTVETDLRGEHATIAPGDYFGFSTGGGSYRYTVSGYPDGVRQGTFFVSPAARVAFTPHSFRIRSGGRTFLTGTVVGSAAAVRVWARPRGQRAAAFVASVVPAGGHWKLLVSPTVTTRYEAVFGDGRSDTLVYVEPTLRAETSGRTVTVTLGPLPRLAHRHVTLFRLVGLAWQDAFRAETDAGGVAVFPGLPEGRYYASYEGGNLFAGRQSEKFIVRNQPKLTFTQPRNPITYGEHAILFGTAAGPGRVAIWARPRNEHEPFRVATVTPVDGRWRLSVSPRVTTRYEAVFAGAKADLLVYVRATLVVRAGHTVIARLGPLPRLARKPVLLWRHRLDGPTYDLWRTAVTDDDGVVVWRQVPAGRYKVVWEGHNVLASVSSAPFLVRP
jgi:hypothetical protein